MIKIAIVEDEIKEQENLLSCLKELQQQEMVSLETQTFSNASSFLEAYRHNFDIVFFDIEMDGLNGMDAAKELRQLDKSVIIIFVTNLAQMAVKGYEVEALDFIVKPIEKATFLLKMKRVLNRTSSKLEESLNIQ
jgi:DNA-binding LytR/AlgR family response regulator